MKFYESDEPPPPVLGEEGASGEFKMTLSVGLQGGFSAKALGMNLSFFLDFGHLDILTVENGVMDFGKSPDTAIKEGFDFGLGPVGLSKEISTERFGENGDFVTQTTETVSMNVFNIEGGGTTQTQNINLESLSPQTKTLSNSFFSASQSGKAAFIGGVKVSSSVTATFGQSKSKLNQSPRYVPSDATTVAPKVIYSPNLIKGK